MATKKTPKKQTAKFVTRPTLVALMSDGKVVVGSRRVAASAKRGHKVLDSKKLWWSQIQFAVPAKSKDGRLHLTTAREAAAKGMEVVS